MLVKLKNLIIDTDSITAIFTDEEKKSPTHHLYVGDRHWEIEQDERDALIAFVSPLDIMARSETKKAGFETEYRAPETFRPDPDTITGFRETKQC